MVYTGVDNFLFRRPIVRARNFTCALDWAPKKVGAQNKIAGPIETQLEIAFCSLLPKQHL